MVQVFLGYRRLVEHLVEYEYDDGKQYFFTSEVNEWCRTNLSGPAKPCYRIWYEPRADGNEPPTGFGRIEFEFETLDDAALFKLFWVGG